MREGREGRVGGGRVGWREGGSLGCSGDRCLSQLQIHKYHSVIF